MRADAGLTGLPGLKPGAAAWPGAYVRVCGAARRQPPLQRTPASERWEGRNTSGPADMDEPRCGVAGGRITPQEPVMPKDHDLKRLVRARMSRTGERYTQARAELAAERGAPGSLVSDRTRSMLAQLASTEVAGLSRSYLEQLPEPQGRA